MEALEDKEDAVSCGNECKDDSEGYQSEVSMSHKRRFGVREAASTAWDAKALLDICRYPNDGISIRTC